MKFRTLLPFTLAALCHAAVAQAGPLTVDDAWVREAPPTAQVLAAYMQITNPADQPRTITGAASACCERVEIHRTEIVDGMARMIPQPELAVDAGATLLLEPGGLHLMLIAPKEPLTQGDHVVIELQLDGGETQEVHAEVRRDGEPAMDHSHHMHH